MSTPGDSTDPEQAAPTETVAARNPRRHDFTNIAALTTMPDDDLVEGTSPNIWTENPYATPSSYQAELQRRLKVAIEALTIEIVASRQSSESADRRLSRLTVVLIVLTVVLAALTVALVVLAALG